MGHIGKPEMRMDVASSDVHESCPDVNATLLYWRTWKGKQFTWGKWSQHVSEPLIGGFAYNIGTHFSWMREGVDVIMGFIIWKIHINIITEVCKLTSNKWPQTKFKCFQKHLIRNKSAAKVFCFEHCHCASEIQDSFKSWSPADLDRWMTEAIINTLTSSRLVATTTSLNQ